MLYDNPVFFEGYLRLRNEGDSINEDLELPALLAALPDPRGLEVLDLGCGFGGLARELLARRARRVLAVDGSTRMLAEARRRGGGRGLEFLQADLEEWTPPEAAFDLVLSSLCLHYIAGLRRLLAAVHATLRAQGRFVCTVEHPVLSASGRRWQLDGEGRRLHWPLDRYWEEGPRVTEWFVPGVVRHHRTVESWVRAGREAGFVLEDLREPRATAEARLRRPDLAEEDRRPPFLLLAWRRD
jgi:SAM-dependent methyltransferase